MQERLQVSTRSVLSVVVVLECPRNCLGRDKTRRMLIARR
jgi:hypothetical protein